MKRPAAAPARLNITAAEPSTTRRQHRRAAAGQSCWRPSAGPNDRPGPASARMEAVHRGERMGPGAGGLRRPSPRPAVDCRPAARPGFTAQSAAGAADPGSRSAGRKLAGAWSAGAGEWPFPRRSVVAALPGRSGAVPGQRDRLPVERLPARRCAADLMQPPPGIGSPARCGCTARPAPAGPPPGLDRPPAASQVQQPCRRPAESCSSTARRS